MSQTKEDRIWFHYKSLQKKASMEYLDSNEKWLTLAEHWKMPIREIKDIIAARKGPTMRPVMCCEWDCFVEEWVPVENDLRDRLDGGEATQAAISEHSECNRRRAYTRLTSGR